MSEKSEKTSAAEQQAALKASPSDIAKLRHLYANLKNGGVRDTAQAKRIADGLLAPIIERLEQATPQAAADEGSDETDWYHGITEKHFDRAVQKAIQRDRASRAAAPKAAPSDPDDHQILAITTAYEQGVGKGLQAYGSGKEVANPYDTGYRCDLAWQYGYKEGKEQAERIAEAAPKQAAPKAAPGEPYQDSTPHLSVGDSSFESWYSSYCPAHKADKQRARDAYAAGMGDPLVRAAPQPAPTPLSDDAKDSARLDWLALAGPTSICLVIDRPHDSEVEVATDDVTGYGKTLREAIDAARKQGGAA